MPKPSIQRIRKSEKGRRANHQLYLVWCYGVRLYAGSEVCRDDDTASPTNLRKAVNEGVAGAANHQEARPRRIQHYQRREGNAEQQHYGVSARDVQGRARSSG